MKGFNFCFLDKLLAYIKKQPSPQNKTANLHSTHKNQSYTMKQFLQNIYIKKSNTSKDENKRKQKLKNNYDSPSRVIKKMNNKSEKDNYK